MYAPTENCGLAQWIVTSPLNSSSEIGNNGGRIVLSSTSPGWRPSNWAGAWIASRAPGRSNGLKNGRP